jgi:hypothetical protein
MQVAAVQVHLALAAQAERAAEQVQAFHVHARPLDVKGRVRLLEGGTVRGAQAVDSFYTLNKRRESIDRLIYVAGFDLGLDDDARFRTQRSWIEEVARECGLRAVFPRTNLRRHPTFQRLGWDQSYGAALAAVAHLMAPTLSTVYVASSSAQSDNGSTPELDPHWSSNAVTIAHDGEEALRIHKAKAIRDWPLVHRFLRVCFARGTSAMNCGACEKCVRTQASFAAVGALDRLATFPRVPLVDLIDGVPCVDPINVESWMMIRRESADAAVIAAVDRLLARRPSRAARFRAATAPWINPWLDRAPGGRTIRRIGKRLLGD